MKRFITGDKAKCISIGNNETGIVTKGKIYKVLSVEDDKLFGGQFVRFINDSGEEDSFGSRFFEKVGGWEASFKYRPNRAGGK